MKQKHIPARCFFYLFGMLVLAMGYRGLSLV